MRFIFPYTPLLKNEVVGDDMIFAFGQRHPLRVKGRRILHLGLWRGRTSKIWTLKSLLPDLAEFYRQNVRDPREGTKTNETETTICVAPDLSLRPKETVRAWDMWHEDETRPNVVPVIQPGSKFSGSMHSLLKQVDYYARWHKERDRRMNMVCLGNSLVRAKEVRDMVPPLVAMIRARGVRYIHVMGAGWDIEDILAWTELGVDSIDSTSYYTDAEAGRRWFLAGLSCIYDAEHSASELVWHNAACIHIALANLYGFGAEIDLWKERFIA